MKILSVIITSFTSIIVLFLLTKLLGKRQISQLSMFDYVVSITIGSIAAEMATELEKPFYPFIAMVVYAVVSISMAVLSRKYIKLRRFFEGKSLILYENGIIYEKNLKSSHMEVNELLIMARNAGYFNLSCLQAIILEPNGKLSFLPNAADRPPTGKEMNLYPQNEGLLSNIIIDGNVMEKNLAWMGKDKDWLTANIKDDIQDIVLATLDKKDTITIYKNFGEPMKKDIYE